MRKLTFISLAAVLSIAACASSCDNGEEVKTEEESREQLTDENLATQNILRAMQITNAALTHYFSEGTAMTEFYNPFTGKTSSGTVDVWPYTSSIEAVNAIMTALQAQKDHGDSELYDKHFEDYKETLKELYDGLAYYSGTFTLTSYTQTAVWDVYGVHRGASPGSANVEGIENVYDDQQWLIRELIEAYRLTGEKEYLERAEYLTAYVIDGWDCTLKEDGSENGGITWGPGYCTKHSCSNGPFVSPLVWLSEMYEGSGETVTYRYIEAPDKRVSKEMDKSEYYLMFAEKVYDYQRTNLYKEDVGLYWDMMGGSNDIQYEMVDGIRYRKNTPSSGPSGDPLSYNSGTMLSGAADLYRVTGDEKYRQDMEALTDACFSYFAKEGTVVPGYYSYAYDGFNNWFNGVMLRGWADVFYASGYPGTEPCLKSFQDDLDYGYENSVKDGTLPTSLLHGFSKTAENCDVKGFFQFAYAAQYATLARYEIEKLN